MIGVNMGVGSDENGSGVWRRLEGGGKDARRGEGSREIVRQVKLI